MSLPLKTRLRTVRSVDPEKIESFLGLLQYRVHGEKHILWYVPDDAVEDKRLTPSVDLEERGL